MNDTSPMFKGEQNLFCANPIIWKQGNESVPFEKSLGAMPFADYTFSDIRKEKDRQLKKLLANFLIYILTTMVFIWRYN